MILIMKRIFLDKVRGPRFWEGSSAEQKCMIYFIYMPHNDFAKGFILRNEAI